MSQPSVTHYFNTRKRPAHDHKLDSVRKVLVLDEDNSGSDAPKVDEIAQKTSILEHRKIVVNKNEQNKRKQIVAGNSARVFKAKKNKEETSQNIRKFLTNMKNMERCVTPPNQVEAKQETFELNAIKTKLQTSSKLTLLKAAKKKFQESEKLLKVAEKRTLDLQQSPKLTTFKSLQFEVPISPQKIESPEKPYLSPKKKEPTVRRNLLSSMSPTKSAISEDLKEKDNTKQGLALPFQYRTFAELFRAIDTVAQILYNRREVITFDKLKPAVEKMLKKNLTEKHLAQIKSIYPDSYDYSQQKIKQYGCRQDRRELVLIPRLGNSQSMTAEVLLKRRRQLYETLIDRVKNYHAEFLSALVPPMTIPKDKITRWHPDFDFEKVPDIEQAQLPEIPAEEKFTTGREVLERARVMFNCNTRMEQALARLKESEAISQTQQVKPNPTSLLMGIPKALLEKVRQRQAAKALASMTRSRDKEKEIQMYERLPEIARLARNVFVTEKKGVLPLDTVVEKLGNSYRCFTNKVDMEDHLKVVSKEAPDWLVFHKVRGSVFLKLAKNADLRVVLNKLETLAKEKNES